MAFSCALAPDAALLAFFGAAMAFRQIKQHLYHRKQTPKSADTDPGKAVVVPKLGDALALLVARLALAGHSSLNALSYRALLPVLAVVPRRSVINNHPLSSAYRLIAINDKLFVLSPPNFFCGNCDGHGLSKAKAAKRAKKTSPTFASPQRPPQQPTVPANDPLAHWADRNRHDGLQSGQAAQDRPLGCGRRVRGAVL